jgi:hypothetical protein
MKPLDDSPITAMAPQDEVVTAYDERHFPLYVQLLDAKAAGMSEDELCRTVLHLEPIESAKAILASHVARATWMTEKGFRQLLGN